MKIKIIFISILSLLIIHTHTYAKNENTLSAQQIILKDINHYRISHGRSQLQLNPYISAMAAQHSRDMANNKVGFGHGGYQKRFKILSAHFKSRKISENVVYTYREPNEVVKLWLKSSGHRKNIEGKYNQTGIGVAYNKYGNIFVTQIFVLATVAKVKSESLPPLKKWD